MINSYIIYIGLGIFAVEMGKLAEEKDDKHMLFFAVIALSLISGLRASTVGIDTVTYVRDISNIINYGISASNSNEIGYTLSAWILSRFVRNWHFVITVFSFITNSLIIYRLWDDKDIISIPWAIFRYYTLFFFTSFNIMRQLVSLSIVFWGTRYLKTKDYYKAAGFFLLGTSFHLSSLISFAFFFFELIDWHIIPRKKQILLVIAVMLSPFIAIILVKYAAIVYQDYLNIGGQPMRSWYFKLLLFLVTLPFLKSGQVEMLEQGDRIIYYRITENKLYYFIGIVISLFSFSYRYAWRLAYPFYIFELVYVGMIAKSAKNRRILCIGMFIIYAVSFINNCELNSMGQMPYKFFWW